MNQREPIEIDIMVVAVIFIAILALALWTGYTVGKIATITDPRLHDCIYGENK